MKLRLTSDMVRLRVDRSDLDQFHSEGWVSVTTPIAPDTAFTFALERDPEASEPSVRLSDTVLTVVLPSSTADAWATSDEVGIETKQETETDTSLQILVEKDLGCLHKAGDETDTFDELADTAS